MNIIEMKISELQEYKNNPRVNDRAVDKVATSIQKYGFKNPIIIDKNNVIVCGHTRLKACKQLGIKKVPCIKADDLTEKQINEFRIVDNKTNEYAEWDLEKLEDEMQNLDLEEFDFENIIFDEEDIDDIEEQAEVEFVEILEEKHNYIVLYFDNEVDFIQAESLLEIKRVKNYSTRKDGAISPQMQRFGVGRIVKGSEAIEKIRKEYENNN